MKQMMLIGAVALCTAYCKAETDATENAEPQKNTIIQTVRSPLGKELDALKTVSDVNDKFLLNLLNSTYVQMTNLSARVEALESEKKEREARREAAKAESIKRREANEKRERDSAKVLSDVIKRGKAFERKQGGTK